VNRYVPTDAEREALMARGWWVGSDGLWFSAGSLRGRTTYRQAMREQAHRDREAARRHREGGST